MVNFLCRAGGVVDSSRDKKGQDIQATPTRRFRGFYGIMVWSNFRPVSNMDDAPVHLDRAGERGPWPVPTQRGARSLDGIWRGVLERLDFAFQPVVNIHTGFCFGYEALLRNVQETGFGSIQDFFDTCFAQGVLGDVEAALHHKALEKFSTLDQKLKVKLFLNLDNRALEEPDANSEALRKAMEKLGLPETSLVIELSERHPLGRPTDTSHVFHRFKRFDYKLAIDDFGTGFSGLQMLYFAEPDFIKIDRFFIADIATDSRKKLFVSHIVNIAHLLGLVVVAEGVETEQEYFVCKDIGCDLVQGYLVQWPTTDMDQLKLQYGHIEQLARSERRVKSSDQKIIWEQIEVIEPIQLDAEMLDVFERFRSDKGATFFPVVDVTGEPVGIVRERDLKDYTYSLYGKDLISNRGYGRKLRQFLSKCPIADINTKAEKILEAFSSDQSSEGVLVVQDMKYVGFLSARSLLRVINEKNLAAARDQNPLTKLPGNNIIHEWLSEALADLGNHYVIVYLDFDNFKPFNDKYGFRLGDRAILMFAELLRKMLPSTVAFVGHVGGDDWFAGFKNQGFEDCAEMIRNLIAQFRSDVESFYDDDSRQKGYITAQDREGKTKTFPLLGASAALLDLPAGRNPTSQDELSLVIADLKKGAKVNDDRMCGAALFGVKG